MTPREAGWSVTGAEPDGPQYCPGSGQVAIFAEAGARLACPVCARPTRAWRVMLSYTPAGRVDAVLIESHYPAREAPTLSLEL